MSSIGTLSERTQPPADTVARRGTAVPCTTQDAELWFAETPEGVAKAQLLCGGCPLRTSCLAGALARREPWGVWGGELFERGVPVARKRRPGRPRKDEDAERRRAEQELLHRLGEASGSDLVPDQPAPGKDADAPCIGATG